MSNQETIQPPLNIDSVKKRIQDLHKELTGFNDLIDETRIFPAILGKNEIGIMVKSHSEEEQLLYDLIRSQSKSLMIIKKLEKDLSEKAQKMSAEDLSVAIQSGDELKALMLIKKGANLHSGKPKQDPIYYAIRTGSVILVEAIAEKGYDIDRNLGLSAIESGLYVKNSDEMIRCLIKYIGATTLSRIIEAPVLSGHFTMASLWVEKIKQKETYADLFDKIGWDEIEKYIPIVKKEVGDEFIEGLTKFEVEMLKEKKKRKVEHTENSSQDEGELSE